MDVIKAAREKNGDNRQPPLPLPTWLNPQLVKDGQDFIRRNFFSVFFAHFISLIFLLCYTPVRKVLMKTGKSDSATKSIKRYLSTLLHVKKWYEGDLLNPEGKTFRDIQRVRRIHSGISRSVKIIPDSSQHVQVQMTEYSDEDKKLVLAIQISTSSNVKCMNQKLNLETKPANFSISQLDMIVTQFCFMGFIFIFPKKLGIHSDESDGLKGFVHLWAVIGNLLGIEDRFNICLEKNQELRKTILDQVLLPDFQKCNPGSLLLWKSFISGLSDYIPFLSLKPVLLFILRNILDLNDNVSDLDSLLNLYEKFCYKAMCLCFDSWLRYSLICTFFNGLLRFTIFTTAKRIRVNIDLKDIPNQNNLQSVVV